MTLALTGYSATFMRYAMAVTPVNYLLFGCHFVNFGAQVTQGYRYLNYWKYVQTLLPLVLITGQVNANTHVLASVVRSCKTRPRVRLSTLQTKPRLLPTRSRIRPRRLPTRSQAHKLYKLLFSFKTQGPVHNRRRM